MEIDEKLVKPISKCLKVLVEWMKIDCLRNQKPHKCRNPLARSGSEYAAVYNYVHDAYYGEKLIMN